MTLVSGNIRFMRMFAGVPWRRGFKRQRSNQKCRFSGLFSRYVDLVQPRMAGSAAVSGCRPLLKSPWTLSSSWLWSKTLGLLLEF